MFKYIAIVLFLISSNPKAYAQYSPEHRIDSLTKILPKLSDTALVDCYNELSYDYTVVSKKDSAIYFATLALDKAKKLQYIHGIAEAISRQAGIVQHFENDFRKEEELAKESLRWFNKTANKKNIPILYDQLAFSRFAQAFYDEAISYLQKEYEYYLESGDKYGTLHAIGFLSAVHVEKGDYDRGFDYARQNLQFALKLNDKAWIKGALNAIGTLCLRIEDYPSALHYYREALQNTNREDSIFQGKGEANTWGLMEFAEIYTHLQQYDSALYRYNLFDSANADEKDLRVFLVSKGEYYLAVKQYSNALQNFLKGLHYHKKLKDTNEIMRTLLNIGKTYAALKAYKAALQYTREGLGIALQTKAKQFIRDGYQTLYLVYDKTQNVDSAFFYYRQYNSMKDLVASAQVKAKFREYNYEQKIIILNQENQIQQAKLARESFQKKLFIAGILVLLALGLMIYRNIFLKRKNEVNRLKIAENELQLQKLESEQTQKELQHKATELEIQALRAQMNPHFIFNCLSSINRFILKNESEAASDYLTKFSRLIRMVLINSKKSFITLEDDLEMLRLYLEMERLRFKNSFDYSMSFQNEVDAGCIYIPPLLLQPFVENAIWHGLMNKEDNGKLLISISKERNYLTCIIEDNGIGRSKATELNSKSAEKKKSLGLQITKERLALLNKETDENTYFEVKDLYDKNGDACGTRIILKITPAEKQEENSPTTNFTL
jgi:hypothetical protein